MRYRICAVLLSLIITVPAFGQSSEEPRDSIAGLKAAVPDARITTSSRTGSVAFMTLPRGKAMALPTKASAPAEARARAFFELYKAAFGLGAQPELVLVRDSGVDAVGMEHVRFQQLYRGIPVAGAESVAHLRGNAVVAASSKGVVGFDHVPTEPEVTSDEAGRAVTADVEQRFRVFEPGISEPRLEIFDRGLFEGQGRYPLQLTWYIEARGTDFWRSYWIDALEGDVVLDFNRLHHAKNREVSDADMTDGAGSVVRSEGDSATGDSEVDEVYELAGQVYDYFLNEHGRDSLNGNGVKMRAAVHWCYDGNCSIKNAVWNGVRTKYTEDMVTDDIVGHEFTHGVIQYTANLYYYMQSGALNESYADIFGEAIDLTYAQAGEPANSWWMGEESALGNIRNLSNPTLKNDPGKMSDSPYFNCGDPGNDAGGVHTNSGVPNHAFALMVSGGIYNGRVVTPIGLNKSAQIQYRALSEYLVSGSDFLDNALALMQSCEDLIGTSGITASDCNEVEDAIEAVEMMDAWPCTNIQATSVGNLCPAGKDPVELYYTDFTSTSDFSFDGSPSWRQVGNFSLSGGKAMRTNSQGGTSLDSLSMTVDIEIPQDGAYLQFDHAFGLANDGGVHYDGAKLFGSTNSGSSWFEVPISALNGATYNGFVWPTGGSPYAGGFAFAGDSDGYVASRINLVDFIGRDLRFSWRLGSGNAEADRGWFLDNVYFYSCSSCEGVDSTGDSDNDDICNDIDNCLNVANTNQADADDDNVGDACDSCVNDPLNDQDNDGVCGDVDNCPADSNGGQADADNDGLGNACDDCPQDGQNDVDGDGVCGDVDNCPVDANAGQGDADGDSAGDACDICPNDATNDEDADGVCQNEDNCPDIPNADQADADGDGTGDACDVCPNDVDDDLDNDGFCADVDCAPNDPEISVADRCGVCSGDGTSCLVLFPVGNQFRINTEQSGNQLEPAVAADPSGDGFLVVWESDDGDGNGIHARRVDLSGGQGDEVQVSVTTGGAQESPAVTALEDGAAGEFFVTWKSDNLDGSRSGIAGRFLNADTAAAAVGSELKLNSETSNGQDSPQVASAEDGGFQVVWRSFGVDPTGLYTAVVGRRFDGDGTPVGDDRVLTTAANQAAPSVSTGVDGFSVVWSDPNQGIVTRGLDSAGALLGSEMQVSSSANSPQNPVIGTDSEGASLVSFEKSGDGSGLSVHGRSVNDSGSPYGSEFQINTVTGFDQTAPAMARLGGGGFLVVFGDRQNRHIRAQAYESDGDLLDTPTDLDLLSDEPFKVNSTTGLTTNPDAAVQSDGTILVVWEDNSVDSNGTGIAGRLFGTDDDADGIAGPIDNCPMVANAGQEDADFDGFGDACDLCVGSDDSQDADNDSIADGCDECTDTDGDGFGDPGFADNVCVTDNCPDLANFDQADSDGDGLGDACDVCFGDNGTGDSDHDGVCDSADACAGADDAVDADLDGVPDACDVCAGSDDTLDVDLDGVPDGCDVCAGSDDSLDSDFDGVPDGCDVCAGSDDSLDSDFDGVPDGCDVCAGSDDTVDSDFDGVPDGCDVCAGSDDSVDSDFDGVPDGCDICAGSDDSVDSDLDGVPDGCDVCAGSDDSSDTDADGVPDGCDVCAGSDDSVDTDVDGVPDGCDVCAGSDDSVDSDFDGVPDGCDVCEGDDASGDGDGDGVCADSDCDDTDGGTQTVDACGVCGGDASTCSIFVDGFELGDTSAWAA